MKKLISLRGQGMPRQLNDPNLTLMDLSEWAEIPEHAGVEKHSRGTVDWARTFLVQISLLAGLIGIRLPPLRVRDGVLLEWALESSLIRVRLNERPPHTIEGRRFRAHQDQPDFSIAGVVGTPSGTPVREEEEYLTFSVRGKFRPDFLMCALVNWFPTQKSFPAPSSLTVRPQPENPEARAATAHGSCPATVSVNESGDVNEAVRATILELKQQGSPVGCLRMTLEQMAELKRGWDGRNASPPSKETLEWARAVADNLEQAASSLGNHFKPLTSLCWHESPEYDSSRVFVDVSLDTGTTYCGIKLEALANHYRLVFLLDYDATDATPSKWYLEGQLTLIRKPGESPFEILLEVLK